MQKKYICVSESFDVGGKESCFIRMFEWVKEQNFLPVLMLKKGTVIDKKWHKKLTQLDVGIFYIDYLNLGYCFEFKQNIKLKFAEIFSDEGNYILSTSMQSWIFINSVIGRVKAKEYYHRFYVLHPHASRGVIHSKILSLPYKLYLVPKMKNNFVFMDKETKDNFVKYNSWNEEKTPLAIMPLPLKVPELDRRIIEKRADNDIFHILTISRMEFPFKGYVLGLINDFAKMCKEKDNLFLTIIGDGKDYLLLEEKIQQLDEEIQKKIRLLGNVAYEELNSFLYEASVYVGMGTTLIDAACTGLISIGATAEQYENYSYGFFKKNCNKIGLLYGEENSDEFCFYDLLNQVYSFSRERFIQESGETYNFVKDTYDIDYIMPKFLLLMKKKEDIEINHFLWVYDKFIVKMRELYNYVNNKYN